MLCIVGDGALFQDGHLVDLSSTQLQLGDAFDALLGRWLWGWWRRGRCRCRAGDGRGRRSRRCRGWGGAGFVIHIARVLERQERHQDDDLEALAVFDIEPNRIKAMSTKRPAI